MGFDLVAPKHVHGPGCGHTAEQVADAKSKTATKTATPVASEMRTPLVSSQFKMVEQATPRQENQNPKSPEQKSTFLGNVVQRFSSVVSLPQKTEQGVQPPLQQQREAQAAQQQPKAQQPQAQAAQPQLHQAIPTRSMQQGQPQVRENVQMSQGAQSPRGQVDVQKQVQSQQQLPISTPQQKAVQLSVQVPALQVVVKSAVPAAAPVVSQVNAQAVAAPQAPVVPQHLPQVSVMARLNHAFSAQLFSATKPASSAMSVVFQAILKNMAPPKTLGLDGKEFAAILMSFMMRERVDRRKRLVRKPTRSEFDEISLAETRDDLADEHPERDRN